MNKREMIEAKYPGWTVQYAGAYYLRFNEFHKCEVAVPHMPGLTDEDIPEDQLFRGAGLTKKTATKETALIIVRADNMELADEQSQKVYAEESKKWRTVWTCSDCEFKTTDKKVIDTDNPFYECNSCGERFSREDSLDGMSHRCPQCSKWGSKVAEGSCPECNSGEMVIGKEEVK